MEHAWIPCVQGVVPRQTHAYNTSSPDMTCLQAAGRLPCAEDWASGRVLLATSSRVLALSPVAMESQVCVCVVLCCVCVRSRACCVHVLCVCVTPTTVFLVRACAHASISSCSLAGAGPLPRRACVCVVRVLCVVRVCVCVCECVVPAHGQCRRDTERHDDNRVVVAVSRVLETH